MASTSVDVASLVGTWLGTLFTAVGLLTIFAKLQSILREMGQDNTQRMKKIAGDWADCVLEKVPTSTQGVIEGVVPNFSAWLQRAYLADQVIVTSMDDRGDCGRAGWSKLFSRLDIQSRDLLAFGGPGERAPFPLLEKPRGMNIRIRVPREELGDLLSQDDALHYGLSASDFAAVIILAGFRPWDFASSGVCRSTAYRGRLLLAEMNPFAMIAKFDTLHAFHDATFKFSYDWQASSDPLQQIEVPVGHAIQLAYGMVRTCPRMNREWVIFPEIDKLDKKESDDDNALWTSFPSVSRLRYLQNVCELFAGVTEIHVVDYVREHEEHTSYDVDSLRRILKATAVQIDGTDPKVQLKAREALNIAHAIASIRPWGAIPILQLDMTVAFRPILEPFFPPRARTVGRLNAELLSMTTGLEKIPSVRQQLSPQQHMKFLSFVNGEKKSFFDNASSCCRFYHEAMMAVFAARGILISEVRFAFAAQIAVSRLGNLVGETVDLGPCISELRMLLGSKSSAAPPEWALDVYCGFLWGWITDSIPMDPLLIDRFTRRVFLG